MLWTSNLQSRAQIATHKCKFDTPKNSKPYISKPHSKPRNNQPRSRLCKNCTDYDFSRLQIMIIIYIYIYIHISKPI